MLKRTKCIRHSDSKTISNLKERRRKNCYRKIKCIPFVHGMWAQQWLNARIYVLVDLQREIFRIRKRNKHKCNEKLNYVCRRHSLKLSEFLFFYSEIFNHLLHIWTGKWKLVFIFTTFDFFFFFSALARKNYIIFEMNWICYIMCTASIPNYWCTNFTGAHFFSCIHLPCLMPLLFF